MAAPKDYWIDVPAGEFWMGGGPRADENPRHRVILSGFRLGRTQVTRREYRRFLDATGHAKPPFWDQPRFADPAMPAVGPSWEDAMAFCRWIRGEWGESVRLPTEAEWELAAKGGREVRYPWGDEPPESLPDYESRWLEGPEPVDAYPTLHPWGFLGLGENVHEWCADWYDRDYYSRSPLANPPGPSQGRRRSSRGGAWRHRVRVSSCTHRSSIPPPLRYDDYGFRIAASLGAGE